MNKFIFTFLATLISSFGIAQNICGTDHFLEKQIQENPSLQNIAEENWILSDGPAQQSEGSRSVKIVPVVFHIFHDGEEGNISYDQILSAMEMINQDFRRTNPDASSTRSIFAPYAVDSEIEFRLATIDPNGNCTKGVVRNDIGQTSYDADNNVKPMSYWPSNQYFNIWVVNSINSGGVSGTILGYAQFPGTGNWSNYGVIIRNDRIGNIGTATSGDRTLTHEIGHCLNLLHTFQSGCGNNCQNSGDRVCDTPPVSFSTQTCDLSQNQCNNDVNGNSVYTSDVVDQIENFMSYNDCQNMYTIGQKARMDNAFSNFSQLSNLISGNNLVATGALNSNPGICSAEFMSSSRVVCVGQEVQFTDLSYFNPISHQWTFSGADSETSSLKNPTVTYSEPGTYPVTLTVLDSNSNSASTQEQEYITVLSSLGKTAPFTDDFESGNDLASMEWFSTPTQSGFGWYLNSSIGFSGNQSIKAEAYMQEGEIEISSFSFDASNLGSASLTFKRAYAARPAESNNFLKISVSGNCGESWTSIKVYGTNTLKTTADLNSPYNNPNTSDWESATINLPSSVLTANLRVKFEYTVNGGNNLFIDDININGNPAGDIQLKLPFNGNPAVSIDDHLNWNATATIDYYRLEIDTDTNFNTLDYENHQINYISSSSSNLDTQWPISNLTHGKTYYWKVTGSLNGVDTALSEVWSFKVDSNILGISDLMSEALKVTAFPNPATDQFYLRIKNSENQDVQILMYDITGNLVKTIHSGILYENETEFIISRENLSNGVYLIQTASGVGRNTQRIILE